ncbi:sugar transferase [Patescibacteria group bacterium]|nr:sugar transferase [Patescibacteria group bacterium]MBU1721682.1 sugar transferase [Patescibacteria group bacterium]MBU1900991.1 sugar transferase [Patescibacteria group bacterium]
MKRFELFFMVLQVPIDAVMLLCAALSAYALRLSERVVVARPVLFDFSLIQFLEYAFWPIVIWIVLFAFAGLYTPQVHRRFAKDMSRIVITSLAALSIISMYLVFSQQIFDSRFLLAAGWIMGTIFIILGRLWVLAVKALAYRKGYGLKHVVIIGDNDVAKTLKKAFKERKELGYTVVGIFPHFTKEVQKKLEKLYIEQVILTESHVREKESLALLRFANQAHIRFTYSADVFATLSSNMSIHPLVGIPMVELKPTRLDGWGKVTKRLFDTVLSVVVLVLVSPVLLLTSIVILLETGWPVIYKNERVGLKRQTFFTYKFRSMYQVDSTGAQFGVSGAEAEEREKELIKKQSTKKGPIYKIANDPRVTKFGHVIRRFSIDELPQFINVIKGEMSIVGPRPHQPREVAHYEKDHPTVFSIRPGITGLAQISGRSDLSFEEEMQLDLLYIERWSLWLDFIVFIKTPFILFKRRDVV